MGTSRPGSMVAEARETRRHPELERQGIVAALTRSASLQAGVRSRRNYNPAVLVFRGLRRPAVYRFYYAFQQAKHGRTQYLDALEAELFRELGV